MTDADNRIARFAVLFNPADIKIFPFAPPTGVSGGIVGSTDKGEMAVYIVPRDLIASFREATAACGAVTSVRDLDTARSGVS